MTYQELLDKINLLIYENPTEDISGDDMNEILKDVASFVTSYPLTNYRNNVVSLPIGTTPVVFTSPLGIDGFSYSLAPPYVYDADGNNVDYKITDRTNAGFKIKVPIACTLEYKATLIQ